jgi:hypothetical protein
MFLLFYVVNCYSVLNIISKFVKLIPIIIFVFLLIYYNLQWVYYLSCQLSIKYN